MTNFDLKETERRMRGALTVLQHEFGGLRTGRASAALLDPIMVNAYGGSPMPLNQLATINVPEPRLITVQVWDKSQVDAVERAIRESDLGLNPVGRRPAVCACRSPSLTRSAVRRSPRSRINIPSRLASRCAMCVATAWSI